MMVRVNGEKRVPMDDRDPSARRWYESGRAAHPQIPLAYEAFAGHLQRSDSPIASTYAPDVYLACACAEGVEAAMAHLERTFVGEVRRAVIAIDASPSFVEDVLQATREKLLVARDPNVPKIATYGGRASLKSWICTVAVRVAISRRRKKAERRRNQVDFRGDEALARGGPELDYLRRRYKGSFEEAIRVAIERLQPRERLLLRLNVIDRLSIDQLAAMYRVTRSTAARWLADARRSLLESARRELQRRLGLDSAELESLARELQSQLNTSVVKLLGVPPT
jgi:RNA polymerase sigma-70 factor (ECF subfamily)